MERMMLSREEPFADRAQAGRLLAETLRIYRTRPNLLVLALPRGGVPVAARVAEALNAPMDVYLVRKLGAPMQPELAMGAIAEAGPNRSSLRVIDWSLVNRIGLSDDELEAVIRTEEREMARRHDLYRGDRPSPHLAGRTIILVDDGAATGSTMLSAIRALKSQASAKGEATKVIVALPVASREAAEILSAEADDFVCLNTPPDFRAVGNWYLDFRQVSDQEVIEQLQASADSLE